jgi:hypothetical protein
VDVKALSYSALFRTTGDKNRSALRPPMGHADHNPYIRFVSGTIKEAAIVKDRFGRLRPFVRRHRKLRRNENTQFGRM